MIEWVTVTIDLIQNTNHVIINHHQSHTVHHNLVKNCFRKPKLFYTYSNENWTTIIYQLGCGEVLWLYLIDTATAVWCRSSLEPWGQGVANHSHPRSNRRPPQWGCHDTGHSLIASNPLTHSNPDPLKAIRCQLKGNSLAASLTN